MSGRTIDKRSHGQTIFMEGISKKRSHGKEAEWFYSKGKSWTKNEENVFDLER